MTFLALPLALLLAGCDLAPRDYLDLDGDGVAWPEDCDGTRVDVHPGAAEVPYDGVDQDCAGDDDFDQDGDGYVPEEYLGATTAGVEGSGALPGDDCWDDPGAIPEECGALNGLPQPVAEEVHPGANDTWYDGVDQDCADDDDFDQDRDGYATDAWPDRAGTFGDDCDDTDSAVNPDAAEVWYDGVDQDCAADDDYDQDGDGFRVDEECDDEDPLVFPNGDDEWVWYDGQDNNCDGNDGDQDGDGYWVADYADRVAASGSGYPPLPVPPGWEGDCDDLVHTAYPGAPETWYDGVDADCADDDDYDQDGDGHAADAWGGDDCDDLDGAVHPGQAEAFYDGTDDDCDGNDGDADGDGYWALDYEEVLADPLPIPSICGDSGALSCAGDCDDGDPLVHPDQLELCSTDYDDDCDGVINEDFNPGGAVGCADYYLDADRDGYGTVAGTSRCLCEPAESYDVLSHNDCDDGDAMVYVGAPETVANGDDEDCDGVDSCYQDADNDDYGTTVVVDGSSLDCASGTGAPVSTDCDDASAEDHPGAYDLPGDGIDQDCDGADTPSTTDLDGDGYDGTASGGSDCDDGDPAVNPGAVESDDDVDDDCDDMVDEGYRVAGDLVISELLYNPSTSEPNTEWFELYNPSTTRDLVLDGLMVYSSSAGGRTFYVAPGMLVIPACGYLVFCYGDSVLGADCDYVYGTDVNPASAQGATYNASFAVGNSGATVRVSLGGTTLDEVAYGVSSPWPASANGMAIGLDPSTLDSSSNDTGSNWCHPTSTHGSGDFGTPGSVNDACFSTVVDADGDGYDSSVDCDDADDEVNPAATEGCDGLDNDCDGLVDDADGSVTGVLLWYLDADLDGYGDPTVWAEGCAEPSGYVADDTDCDDGDDGVNPGASEVCDARDEDCDGSVDDGAGCPCAVQTWGGHGYLFCTSLQMWYTADGLYSAYGYELVTVGDAAEQAWLVSAAAAYTTSACWWIGFNDQATEGTWVWASGEVSTYTAWYPGEPNDGSASEDCAEFETSGSGMWWDEHCWSSCYAIHEAL